VYSDVYPYLANTFSLKATSFSPPLPVGPDPEVPIRSDKELVPGKLGTAVVVVVPFKDGTGVRFDLIGFQYLDEGEAFEFSGPAPKEPIELFSKKGKLKATVDAVKAEPEKKKKKDK